MECISVCISLLALAGTIYTYFRHDKKLKKQQGELNEQGKLINKYKIDKIEAEKEDSKKADVKAMLTSTGTGKEKIWTLSIYNNGKADATNVRIKIDPNNKIEPSRRQGVLNYIDDSKFPLEILPSGNNINIRMRPHGEFPDTLEVRLIWNDGYGNDRESNAILSILY
jgi:hypothetical protein